MSPRKITIELELDLGEQQMLLQTSLERVLNNAIFVGSKAERAKGDLGERASTLWQDCEMLLPLTRKVWGAAAEALRVELFKEED